MIIGITGTNSAGKDSIASLLINKGFSRFSISDALREEARKRGLGSERQALIDLGNELRANFGAGVLAMRVLEMVSSSGKMDSVVVSIRNPEEAKVLAANGGFMLVWVDAPPRMRYQRSISRKRDAHDLLSFEGFMEMEASERDAGPTGQRLDVMKSLAGAHIQNDGSLEELRDKVEHLLHSRDKPKS